MLDRSHFRLPPHDPAKFDGDALRPYNVGPDALLVNFKAVRFVFAPGADGTGVAVRVEPPLPQVTLGTPPRLAGGDCNDWRGTLRAAFSDRGTEASASFAGVYPARCGERDWYVALLDAPAYALGMFTASFRAAGGEFAGGVREGRAPPGAVPFATLTSPPLADIIRDVNKLSNNVMARQVFLTLATVGHPPPATADRAAATVREWLRGRMLRLPGLVLENGSGLSRHERISAKGLARLLAAADASRVKDEFATSLAIAAVDGTVEKRFQNGSVAGQALLKTGTLEGVKALAGYVTNVEGRRYIVVALVNHPNAAAAQPALDTLVQWVHRNAGVREGLDPTIAALDAHPNIEVRLYNPVVIRDHRALNFVTDFTRVNRRMHNKSFTADNQATVVGGRNIADEYFGAGAGMTFADLDVLAVGPAVPEVSREFDVYWNSASAYPASAFVGLPAPDGAANWRPGSRRTAPTRIGCVSRGGPRDAAGARAAGPEARARVGGRRGRERRRGWRMRCGWTADGNTLEWVERTASGEKRYDIEPETDWSTRMGVGLLSILPIEWLL